MDFLTAYVTLATSFMENLVKLAWPVAVLGVAWLFRGVIAEKLIALQGVDGYGMKLTFGEKVEVLAERAKYVADVAEPSEMPAEPLFEPKQPENASQNDLSSVINGAHVRLVTSHFSELVSELRRVAGPHGYTRSGQKRFVESVLKSLLVKKVIGLDLAQQISQLRELRNMAVHNPENITDEEYYRYFELVAGATEELKKLEPLT